jgi:glyceraldehyde 3-phosphate dehydrogenase
VEQDVTADAVNAAFREAASGGLAGVLAVSDEPLVSVDYIGNSASSIVDALSTSVLEGRMVKVLSWYDNEWGYSTRVVDLVRYVGERLAVSV